jgi:hypothetical protein
VATVTGGLIAHPLDAAGDLLRYYRDAVAEASDDLIVFAGLVHAPRARMEPGDSLHLDRPGRDGRRHPLGPGDVRDPAAPAGDRALAQLPRRRPGRGRRPRGLRPDYDRLREVKRRYGPDNTFRLNQRRTLIRRVELLIDVFVEGLAGRARAR